MYGRDRAAPSLRPWIEWQFAQVTSLRACWPDSQNARCRLPAWQVMQTAVFSAAVAVLDAAVRRACSSSGPCRCSLASPWQAWHMLPLASFFAPCAVCSSRRCDCSWQPAQIGTARSALGGGAACWAATWNDRAHAMMPSALTTDGYRIAHPFEGDPRRQSLPALRHFVAPLPSGGTMDIYRCCVFGRPEAR